MSHSPLYVDSLGARVVPEAVDGMLQELPIRTRLSASRAPQPPHEPPPQLPRGLRSSARRMADGDLSDRGVPGSAPAFELRPIMEIATEHQGLTADETGRSLRGPLHRRVRQGRAPWHLALPVPPVLNIIHRRAWRARRCCLTRRLRGPQSSSTPPKTASARRSILCRRRMKSLPRPGVTPRLLTRA